MKTYFYTTILIIAILLPLSIHANTFCVSDATGLQTALTTASGNGEDDTVQIEQGTYVGSFIYTSLEAFNLTVEGGYLSECDETCEQRAGSFYVLKRISLLIAWDKER